LANGNRWNTDTTASFVRNTL